MPLRSTSRSPPADTGRPKIDALRYLPTYHGADITTTAGLR
jgi:hypothetical protein